MHPIPVVVTINENYAQHLCVMLNSLMQHASERIDVYLLFDELSADSTAKFRDFASQYPNLNLIFKEVADDQFKPLFTCFHFPLICYFRFVLASVLPDTLEKVVYLDPDLVVLEDICGLWNMNISNAWVAGVAVSFNRHRELGLPAGDPYFNSGVMLFNLAEWRKQNLEKLCFDQAMKLNSVLANPDQDVLNIVCANHWSKLPLKWNKTNEFFAWPSFQPYGKADIRMAKGNVGIVHYTGSCKPWHYSCVHPARKLYWDYIRGTPWEGASLEAKRFSSALIRTIPFRVKNIMIRLLAACQKHK